MMKTNTALELILKGLAPALAETGFKESRREGEGAAFFAGEAGVLCIELAEDRAALRFCEGEEEGDYTQLSLSLLELDEASERDCKYISSEFAEVVSDKFGKRKKTQTAAAKKPPKSVSKTAIRNGDAYYDALSFGNAFTGAFPELRGEYRANYEKHGEFMAEEFFRDHGNALVMEIIREGDKARMKRLFSLFNEVYENGVNDVQSLVAVTVLGSIGNDEVLLARCTDYMSRDLAPVVIRVNQYLASGAGRSARKKLENPPPYKPKKQKKPGLLQQMMMGGGQNPLQ